MTGSTSGRAPTPVEPERHFEARTRSGAQLHIVEISGELDVGSRADAIDACTSSGHRDVLVDLSGLTFMDCAGYGGLAASTAILVRRGGSLVLMNPVGGPSLLLALIEQLSPGLCAPLRNGAAPAG